MADPSVDAQVVEILTRIEAAVKARQQCCDEFANALFSLVHARHCTEFAAISQRFFPERMRATLRVRGGGTQAWSVEVHEPTQPVEVTSARQSKSLQKASEGCKTRTQASSLEGSKSGADGPTTLAGGTSSLGETREEWMARMRREMSAMTLGDGKDAKDVDDADRLPCVEPTRWFGPSNARVLGRSKRQFRACAEHAARLASINAEVLGALAELDRLERR